MKLHLVRHAEADYNLEQKPGEFPGVPLTKTGKQQAQQISSELSNFVYNHIFCSDMLRTKETLNPSLAYLAKTPVYDSRLREISDAVTSNHEDNWFAEPKDSQIQRMESFLESIKSLDGEILVIAHYGVIEYLSEKLGKKIDSPAYARHYILEL